MLQKPVIHRQIFFLGTRFLYLRCVNALRRLTYTTTSVMARRSWRHVSFHRYITQTSHPFHEKVQKSPAWQAVQTVCFHSHAHARMNSELSFIHGSFIPRPSNENFPTAAKKALTKSTVMSLNLPFYKLTI